MTRTVRDIPVNRTSVQDIRSRVMDWLQRYHFQVMTQSSDGSDLSVAHWDGSLLIRSHRGSIVASRGYPGGGTVVFELGLPQTGEPPYLIHFEGWITGRGPGWKGKEYDFLPTALAIAGVLRKKGLELLGEFQAGMSTTAAASVPLQRSGQDRLTETGTELPLESERGAAQSDLKTRPNNWTDRRVWRMAFPYRASDTVGPVEARSLEAAICESIRSERFEIVMDVPPEFDGKPTTPSRFDRHTGIVVGERGLRINRGLRRRTAVLLACVAAVVVISTVLLLTAASSAVPIQLVGLPVGLLLGVSLVLVGRLGSFDSDILWVAYSVAGEASPGQAEQAAPHSFSIRVGAGSVASQNWAGRGASGRNLRRIGSTNISLLPVPGRVAQSIRVAVAV